jgi:hypothetical protein
MAAAAAAAVAAAAVAAAAVEGAASAAAASAAVQLRPCSGPQRHRKLHNVINLHFNHSHCVHSQVMKVRATN